MPYNTYTKYIDCINHMGKDERKFSDIFLSLSSVFQNEKMNEKGYTKVVV
jgi:hypothetical protein